ncbi:MAG: hypothetical protein IJK60_04380 [Clostridia bacterium]|nr:hypothetical protein [Clostridia bacterium]
MANSKSIINRILCFIVCLFLFSGAVLPASAISINSGLTALRGQWSRSEGPSAGGMSLEYSYYVPSVQEPCPLVVLLGGAGEGTPSGNELKANKFANWSSDEFQSRAAGAGGMYILILKAPEPVYFDTCPLAPMFAAIKDFAEKHNVDKRRIAVGGWCIGASGAARLAVNHPDFFSGLILFSPRTIITDSEAKTIRNMKVWILACDGDTYSPYLTYGYPSWQSVARNTANKASVRCTTCTTAPRAALLLNHETWRLAEYDFSSSVLGDFTNLKTVDGYDNTVGNPSMISFMTAYRSGEEPSETQTETETETQPETETAPKTAANTEQTDKPTSELSTAEDEPLPAQQESRAQKPLMLLIAAGATALIAAGVVLIEKRKKKEE